MQYQGTIIETAKKIFACFPCQPVRRTDIIQPMHISNKTGIPAHNAAELLSKLAAAGLMEQRGLMGSYGFTDEGWALYQSM